jgi:hypothetical protein
MAVSLLFWLVRVTAVIRIGLACGQEISISHSFFGSVNLANYFIHMVWTQTNNFFDTSISQPLLDR